MKVRLTDDILYSKLTDLVCMDKKDSDTTDFEFFYDVINTFMTHGHVYQIGNDLELFMTAGDIIDLKVCEDAGPDYFCDYHGLMLDFNTDGTLEVTV